MKSCRSALPGWADSRWRSRFEYLVFPASLVVRVHAVTPHVGLGRVAPPIRLQRSEAEGVIVEIQVLPAAVGVGGDRLAGGAVGHVAGEIGLPLQPIPSVFLRKAAGRGLKSECGESCFMW